MLKPIGARVAIEPAQGDSVSEGGLVLSDSNNTAMPVRGKVIARGNSSQFDIGDILYFRRYSVDVLKMNEGGLEKIINMVDDADIVARETDTMVSYHWYSGIINWLFNNKN